MDENRLAELREWTNNRIARREARINRVRQALGTSSILFVDDHYELGASELRKRVARLKKLIGLVNELELEIRWESSDAIAAVMDMIDKACEEAAEELERRETP